MVDELMALFPLNTVLFPGMPLPLHIFEERYKLMIGRCIEQERPFGVVLIQSGPEVGGTAIGTTGYCLGGYMSLVAATGLGRTVAAAASFHGGRLAVADNPSSPHLAADRITATVYVAGATDDDSFTAAQAELLRDALAEAGVDFTLEIYPARHGFAVPDNPTYDEAAQARHWDALARLYRAKLAAG